MDEETMSNVEHEASYHDDGILYDVSHHVEFPEEKEVVRSTQLEDIQSGLLLSTAKSLKTSISRWTWSTIRAVGIPVRIGAPFLLPSDLIKLVNNRQSWLMARSPDGNFLAILQDNCLEIRSSKDEYNVVVGRCVFSKDAYPQWRTVSWSRQSTSVAFSDSDGTVHVCDIKGMVTLSFHGHLTDDKDSFNYSTAVCALPFLDTNAVNCDTSSLVLMVVSYSGAATCLEINENFDGQYKVMFQFDFFHKLPKGVSSVSYDTNHNILVVGGCTGYGKNDVGVPKATKYGITAWRTISEEPFLKSIDVFIESCDNGRKRSLLRRLSTVHADLGKKLRGDDIDGVYAMSMSPCSRHLAVIHLSGTLSVWEVPSFRQRSCWKSIDQPFYDEMPTDNSNALTPSKKLSTHPYFQNIIGCEWWDDSSVIIARCSGSLAVVSVLGDRLESLFGDNCEWLEPAPEISMCRDEGFVALECETNVKALKRQREHSDNGDDFPVMEDSDDDEVPGVLQHLKNNTKSTLYQWTDIDYFRPPRKRPKLIVKSYRLLSITKTTPEKLFEKRLEDEEYGEALVLAQKYNLDGDKVFQRQWKKSAVSVASIQDYLSKISKRSWVMHECCERVPDNLDAAKELLKFALSVTDIDELAKLSEENQDIDSNDDSDYEEYQGFDVEEQCNQEIRRRQKFVDMWSKHVDLSNLSLAQKEMIRARKRIIKYLDRLSTYESLLGGYDAARERYNKDQFSDFRQKDIFTSALEYARSGNWKALDTLLMFHSEELHEHRLPLLCNIPKTTSPSEYSRLLPCISEDNSVEQLETVKHRDLEDWCEKPEYSALLLSLTNPKDPATEYYEENPTLLSFRTSEPTHQLVTKWYLQQACEFDEDALDIDGAIELLKIGTENYVEGLESLTNDLNTLETLVYQCNYDTVLTLKELQKKTKLGRLEMLMGTSSKEMYVKNFHRWALPFLKSCEKDEVPSEIFKTFIKELAENDLTLPSLIFVSFLRDRSMPTEISSHEDLAKFAFDCIYINSNANQLDVVKNIYQSLVNLEKPILNSIGSDKIAQLDNHIYTCSLLARYGIKITPDHVREVESDRMKVEKLLVRFSRTVGAREPSLDKTEWNAFLKSMIQLKDKVFSKTCGLEAAVCIGVFVESLLTSGNIKNFKIAGEHMMRTCDEEHEATRRRLYSTSQQKLSYESSVALVIKSSQEYFDASTPTSDDNMLSIARECLLLISDRPESIRERLDLIEGVVLLQKFGVDKLPLQVRLMEDRFSLIDMALNADPEAYRKTEPLLRLAMLLHIGGNNKDLRKGKVLVMIVEKALATNDLDTAYCLCQELVCMPFPPAWKVCFELAKSTEFGNVVGKKDILSFVACHCHDLKLSEVLELINALNSEILQSFALSMEKMEENNPDSNIAEPDAVGDDQSSLTNGNAKMTFDKLVHGSAGFLSPANMLKNTAKGTKAVLSATGNAISATGAVLSATSNTTKAVLSNVKNVEWWRSTIDKTLSSGLLPGSGMEKVDESEEVVSNSDLGLHGCPEFYSGVIGDCVNRYGLLISEEKIFIPTNVAQNQALLRTRQLSADNSLSLLSLAESGLLETLIGQILPYDFALGLSYALTLQDIDVAYRCLEKLPSSAFSLQLSLYYFALRLTEYSDAMGIEDRSQIYDIPPIDLIKQALEWLSATDVVEGSQIYRIATYMSEIQERMFEFAQGERLQQLDRGIDLKRFAADSEYREETILGLAMTMDDEQYKIAVSSAHRSGTDLWLVLMTHLEFLFTECQDQLDCIELQQRIEALNMLPELLKRPLEFFDKMDRCVFPFIDGKDHDRLLLFYSLLSQCKDGERFGSQNGLCTLSPASHVKMLKKVKSITSNFDYKAVVADFDPTSATPSLARVLGIVHPVLDASNVQMFAKMLSQIPYSDGNITSSTVYLELSRKIMSEGRLTEKEELKAIDDINWVLRFESCGAYLRMCFPTDLQLFFEFVLYHSEFSKNMPLGSRQDLIKRGVKLCKIQATKERKKQLDESISTCDDSFSTVLPSFLRMSKHLDSFSTSFLSNLIKKSADDSKMKKYLHLYDESQSKPELTLNLATLMLEDGASPNFIQNFFAVVPGNKWTCKHALKKSINDIVSQDSSCVVDKLSVVVKSVSDHEKEGGKILSSTEVIDLLRPFCSDVNVDSKLRVDVLKLLEDQFQLEDSEARLLLLHRTEAIIKDSWDEESCDKILEEIGSSGIVLEPKRLEVFKTLSTIGDLNTSKCRSLIALLDIWPKFETNSSSEACWCSILLALAENGAEGHKELVEVVRNRLEIVPKSLIKKVFHELIALNATFYAIKLALLAAIPELQKDVIAAIKSVKIMGPSQCDEEVLVLMLENSIAVHTIDTLYFGKIAEYLLSGECPNAEQYVHQLARQLQDLGHLPEAGTLLLNFRGTHPAFRTFGNALSSLKRWLNS